MSRGGYNPTDEEIESMFREGGISLLKYWKFIEKKPFKLSSFKVWYSIEYSTIHL
jgi:hypothetical protein